MNKISEALLKKITKKKAIFFDMDGTIINSEPIHAKTIIKILEELEINLPINEELLIGKTDSDVYNDFIRNNKELKKQISLEQFLSIKNSAIINIIDSFSREQIRNLLTEGVLAFINYLKAHQYRLALISASEPEIVFHMLKTIGITEHFDLIRSSIDTANSKPSPSPYLSALRFFKIARSEAITFEDSPTGTMASISAGIETIQIVAFTKTNNFNNIEVISNFF